MSDWLNSGRTSSPYIIPLQLRSPLRGSVLINWLHPPLKLSLVSMPSVWLRIAKPRGGHAPLPVNAVLPSMI